MTKSTTIILNPTMYYINEQTIAIEKGDKLTIVRDGGGELDIYIGASEAMRCEDGPHTITKGEEIIIEITPVMDI